LKYIAAVDPGKNACGLSIWGGENFSLIYASLVKNPLVKTSGKQRAEKWGDMGRAVLQCMLDITYRNLGEFDKRDFSLVLEIPQVYEGYQDEDKNDLIDLSGVQGALVAVSGYEVAWCPTPREWKGQLPKELSEDRVRSRLPQAELDRVEWPVKRLQHNVWDALHLGIVYLERESLRVFKK
jgi:hypothetical protein